MIKSAKTDEKLRESEQRLSRAQAIAHVGDWEWDLATNAVHWSDELYRIYGFNPQEIAPDYDLVLQQMHTETKKEFLQAIDAALNKDYPFEMDYLFFRKDGSEAVLHTIGEVVRNESGEPVRMVGIVQEITEQKRLENLLRQSEDKFRTIFEKANDGILIADTENKIFIEANRTICEKLGYSRDELCSMWITDIHPEEDLTEVQEFFERLLCGEILVADNVPVKRRDGTVFVADITATPMQMEGRLCLCGIFHDTTERLQAEEQLRIQGNRLAESQRMAHIGSWEHNLLTNKAYWSDELFRLFGLEPVTGGEDFDLFFSMVHPEDQPKLKASIEETLKTGKPFNIDYRLILKDGTCRILRAIAELIPDDSGKLVILSGTAQDVTENKLTEEKIKRNERYIRGILNTVDEGFIVVDRDYRIHTVNRSYCDQRGLQEDQVLGKFCYEVSHKLDRPCFEEGEECCVREVFTRGEPYITYHRHEDADGNLIYVETKGFPLTEVSGKVTRVIETISDITEKRLLEAERLKVQKLEAIGTLAGGIAHDFNNLLQGVFGYLSMAKLSVCKNPEAVMSLDEAEKFLRMTIKMTNQLLTFSKGGKPVKKTIDLRSVVESAVRFSLSGSSVYCSILGIDTPCYVDADEGQITQVIQNFILNAIQAMPNGGKMEVSLNNIQKIEAGTDTSTAKGGYIEIAIQDNGIGIPDEVQAKIFDPYFTTRENGTGLGLATSYSIIKNHGGWIKVDSQVGSGTTFFLYLPVSEPEHVEQDQPRVSVAELNQELKVLVMDDEPMITELACRLISKLGHQVDCAENGEQAVEKYRKAMKDEKPFDLTILDLTVRGGMGGKETLQMLQEINPEVKAVVSSGYSASDVVANYRESGFMAFLNKPYGLQELRSVLHGVLDLPHQTGPPSMKVSLSSC